MKPMRFPFLELKSPINRLIADGISSNDWMIEKFVHVQHHSFSVIIARFSTLTYNLEIPCRPAKCVHLSAYD